MSKRHNILPTRDGFFISSARKIENMWEFKINHFKYLLHLGGDINIKIISSHIAVFNENAISNKVHLFKYFPITVLQNHFNLFKCTNQTGMNISKFLFAVDQ